MLKRLIQMSCSVAVLPDIRFGDAAKRDDVPLLGLAAESNIELAGCWSKVTMQIVCEAEIGVSAHVCWVECQDFLICNDGELGLLGAQIRLCIPVEPGDFRARCVRAGEKRRVGED